MKEERNETIIEFDSEPFNFEKAGFASTEIKKHLKSLKIDSSIIRPILSIIIFNLSILKAIYIPYFLIYKALL